VIRVAFTRSSPAATCDSGTRNDRDDVVLKVDPSVPLDSDCDGLPDSWETTYRCMQANTVDNLADYDSDGLNNEQEYANSTDPCDPDTDDDDLTDGAEVLTYLTDPLLPDTDGDLLLDGWEAAHSCMNPLVGDSLLNYDGDQLTNSQEYARGLDPCTLDPCNLVSLDIVPVASLPGGTIDLDEGDTQNFTGSCSYSIGCLILADACSQTGGVNWSKSGDCSISPAGPSLSTLATANVIPGPSGGSCQVQGSASLGAGSDLDITNIIVVNHTTLTALEVTPDSTVSLAEGASQGFQALATYSDDSTEQVACGGLLGATTWNLTGDLTAGGCASNQKTVTANQIPCSPGGSGTVNAT
jgi:hypothetical protein